MSYSLKIVAQIKRLERELQVAELLLSLGATKMDKIRNVIIRGTALDKCLGDKARGARRKHSPRLTEKLLSDKQDLSDSKAERLTPQCSG